MAHLNLRDYPIEALESVKNNLQSGITKQLIVLPTGTTRKRNPSKFGRRGAK